jgi:hypothetical protein
MMPGTVDLTHHHQLYAFAKATWGELGGSVAARHRDGARFVKAEEL